MSRGSVLARGRRAAEAGQLSRVAVMRPTGGTTTGPDGWEVPEWATVYADLAFRLDSGSTSDGGSKGVSVGGVTYEAATAVGHFPADTTGLADGDLIEVTSGETTGVWQIVAAVAYDQQTARRLPLQEATRPEEWGA